MARPRKEGMDYFPHDVNLSSDKKVEALRIIHGNDGYVFYCIMLELIYQERDFALDVSDAETIQILAKKVEVTTQKLIDMISTSIKHGCFDREYYEKNSVLTSNGIKKRASVVIDKREKMREKSLTYAVPVISSPVSSVVSDAEIGVESTQSKRKVKVKDKVKVIKDIKPIADSDECDLSFQKFWDSYPTKGSNKKMTSQKWTTLWKNKKINLQEMLDGASRYVSFQNHHGYSICAAQVFLNQERWRDEWIIEEQQRSAPKGFSRPKSGTSGKVAIPIAQDTGGSPPTEEEYQEMMRMAAELQASKEGRRV
ncbi:hypothetical protein J2T13_000834 [Paenibacillus sp. DS2015]|uniref:DUF4373 domain-containing protein n=1 Tax=Paenibacillus sp. DS2015 TaxID=3373917 RepID=UPI003D1E290A